jgi:endoglucanase
MARALRRGLAVMALGGLTSLCPAAEKPVDKIHVLSPEWIVVANDYTDEFNQQIYDNQKAEWETLYPYYQNLLDEVEKTGGRLDWMKLKRRRHLYIAEYVRISRQMAWLKEPASYAITGPDGRAMTPAQVVPWVNSLGDAQWPENSRIGDRDWKYQLGRYAYLKLPHPLKSGQAYVLRQKDGRSKTFTYDDRATVNRCLKVNQVGYLADAAHKYAYLGGWIPTVGPVDFSGHTTFSLVDEQTGKPVFEGTISLRAKDFSVKVDNEPASYGGEDTYEMDFGPVTQAGTYHVQVPGVGRSWPFAIGENALGEAFYVAARGFYHQRCGCALTRPHTAWERGECHRQPVGECGFVGDNLNWKFADGRDAGKEVSDFTIIRDTGTETTLREIYGGWHDAADYDRRASHNIAVWDLLVLYAINGPAFTDGQLNLPESGNGIPDILDEARYGIDVWKRAQLPDGSVTGRIETIHHPQHKGMPDRDTEDRWYASLPDRKSTMTYAGSAAMYARLIKPFSPEQANEYLTSAQKAYAWASDPKHSRNGHTVEVDHKGVKTKVTVVENEDDHLYPAFMAAINLHLTTGDRKYLDDINITYGPDAVRRFESYPNYLYSYVPVFLAAGATTPDIDAALKAAAKASILKVAEEPLQATDKAPYRHAWRERSRRWGWALAPTWTRYLILAHALTADEKYRAAALFNIDFHLGCNPLGMVQTTGIGTTYLPTIQDAETREDGIVDPVPGLTSYGVVDIPHTFLTQVYTINVPDLATGKTVETVNLFLPEGIDPKSPAIPHWRQIAPSGFHDPICNEFSVPQTTGPTALMLGAFLGQGWMPSEALKQRGPMDKADLAGYLWLP